MDRWFEISNRRSRLRSATRMLASHYTPFEGTKGITKTGFVLENSGNERHPQQRQRPDDCAEDGIDPEYCLFLKYLKENGKSYVLEMNTGDGRPSSCVKYEAEDDPFTGVREDDSSDVISSQSGRRPCNNSKKTRYYEAKKKLKKGSSSSNSSEVFVPSSAESEVECSMIDEDYKLFMCHAREYNGSMILELDNNVSVIYEEEDMQSKKEKEEEGEESKEDKNSKSSQVLVSVKTEDFEEESYFSNSSTVLQPYIGSPRPSNSLACEDDGCSIETIKYTMTSVFTKRLKDILQKPFDQSEYDNLMLLATSRTPKTKLKHLRNTSKPYATDQMGCSYLDYYPKLANQIKGADYQVGLTLLRGFFFWLENMVHDGAFMPYLSASSSCITFPSGGCSPMLPLQIEMSEN